MKTIQIMMMAAAAALSAATACLAQTRGGFELGAQVVDYGLRQRVGGELVERDEARFGGFTAAYTKTFGNGAFVRGALSIAVGSADIKDGGGTTQLADVDQGVGSLELHAGRDFRLSDRVTVSPFAGFGRRALVDDSGGIESADAVGFDRRVRYSYVPVGADATFGLRGGTTLTLTAQVDWLVGGRARADLSDVDAELPNVSLAIDGGRGVELRAMLGLPLGRHELRVGPFLRRWSADRSKSVTLPGDIEFFEPRTRSSEAGVRLAFAF